MPLSIIVLSLVLIGIFLRKLIFPAVSIWMLMTAGAVLVLLLQQISVPKAFLAIDFNVIVYLFGLFVVAQAAEKCGYLAYMTDKLFLYVKTGKQALLIIVFIMGLSAALLMNDTLAIVGAPIIVQLCKHHKKLLKPLLLALAFSITIGSVLSPIGNPQNLLIAIKGNLPSPFISFFTWLTLPTLINLMIAYFIIFIPYQRILREKIEKPSPVALTEQRSILLVKLSLSFFLALIILKIVTEVMALTLSLNLSAIAILAALPILLGDRERLDILKHIDWGTLIFFVSLFVLMQSVWDSGFFQSYFSSASQTATQPSLVLIVSLIVSQFISNVPLVALYLPFLQHHGASEISLLALAAGSTIAGNVTILGAASNIIITHYAEKRGHSGLEVMRFTGLGILLTILNALIYMLFL